MNDALEQARVAIQKLNSSLVHLHDRIEALEKVVGVLSRSLPPPRRLSGVTEIDLRHLKVASSAESGND